MTIAPDANPTEELLVLASLTDRDVAETARMEGLATQLDVDGWHDFANLADLNATIPLVRNNLQAAKLLSGVPADVLETMDAIAAKIAMANDARMERASDVLRRFANAGIQCIILKGMLFSQELYGDPHYKRMNDLDILIHIEDIDKVLAIYHGLDLFSVAQVIGREPKAQVAKSHHLPSFVTRDGALVIGTHWGLITPLAPYTIDYDAIWSRVRRIDFCGIEAWAMADIDNLHHLLIHLPYYKTGVRELADIYNLYRHTDIDWDALASEMRKAGSENLVYYALSLAGRLVPNEGAASLLQAIEGDVDTWFRRDVARKTRDISVLLRSRSVHLSVIEKAYAEFNITRNAAEKWDNFQTLWANLLLPPVEDVHRFSSLQNPDLLTELAARVAAPYRISKVFVRDLGKFLFPAALAKTLYDMGEATIRFVRGQDGPDIGNFAREVGITAEQLQALRDSQQ